MDIPQEIDDIKQTIENSLGLQISTQSLQLKLCYSEEAQRRLRDQCLYPPPLWKLKEKDQIIERRKAEANMNAVAMKRFLEENQNLATECANLLTQCNKWERECLLYNHDREALMDYGNEVDERAKESEIGVHQLEDELGKLIEELKFYKRQGGRAKRKFEKSGDRMKMGRKGEAMMQSKLFRLSQAIQCQSHCNLSFFLKVVIFSTSV
ncbi:uncharacterized protein LOC111310456 isoform X2 [Durio zibethinus]|uniref:Uncharacterized protein LOC111310456 isoform X2 n=1 Tax=Durio zibethinus TaxID=66656 RepID=A0A6P6ALD0_DURZI|nr:uncharacterized protein LOC111310456 isoform X2 [Durio zibethinus]